MSGNANSFRERYGRLAATGATRDAVPAPAVWGLPDGARLFETADGHCVVHDAEYSGPEITLARDALVRCVAADAGRYLHPDDVLFLDTETTGLAGGTGTYVFLVGLGRFTARGFTVRQLFMRHPGEELALLAMLSAELRGVDALVTYNGRSFDWPLIDTRFRMHGRPVEPPSAHFDLLATARAIWKHRLVSCSLGSIEQAILGVERTVDAPGWLIPQLYFAYLRSRDVGALLPVFEHNRMDIVSLARLMGLVHAWEAGIDEPPHAIDALATALHRLRRYPSEAAIEEVRRRWVASAVPAELRLRAVQQLSVTLKRARRYDEAVEVWQDAMRDPSRALRLFAAEELAKYLEHRARDHHRALEIARQAVDGAELARDDRAKDEFLRRTRRLEAKVNGQRV